MMAKEKKVNFMSQFIKIVIILIVTAGIVIYLLIMQPVAKKKSLVILPSLVSVVPAEKATGKVWVEAMGTVTAVRDLNIVAEVGGRITWISDRLSPGGVFNTDEVLVKIEKTDYEIAIDEAKASLALAKRDLLVEKGEARSAKAIEDMTRTNASQEARDLRLRIPHIQAAEADLRAAEKTLEKSEQDLRRTEVKAPFPILIESENIEIGHYVTKLSTIANAIGTDTFWVEVAVAVDKLKFLKIPNFNADIGSVAKIIMQGVDGSNNVHEGRIVRVLGNLDESGRMARILVAVEDPLGLKNKIKNNALFINSYVEVKLEGEKLDDMIRLERSNLREGNTVWIMDNKNKLVIEKVNIAWRDKEAVYVSSGLAVGDKIVTSSNFVPVVGMELKTVESHAANL